MTIKGDRGHDRARVRLTVFDISGAKGTKAVRINDRGEIVGSPGQALVTSSSLDRLAVSQHVKPTPKTPFIRIFVMRSSTSAHAQS
jgi:hypothetical protein